MQRRTFFKALVGVVCGGVGVLLWRDRVRVAKTPLDFWDDPAEDVYTKNDGQSIGTTYETISLNADMADGTHVKPTTWSSGDWGVACPFCASSGAVSCDKQPLLFGCKKCGAVFNVKTTESWPALLYREC